MRDATATGRYTVEWGVQPLGVTLGIEETSRLVIVTRSTRSDVHVGDVVVAANGHDITEATLAASMAALKQAHAMGASVSFVFAPPPPPVQVKKCTGALKDAGVDASFELRYVDGRVVRYLDMRELHILISNSHKPCTMAFVQPKEKGFYSGLQRQEQQRRKHQHVSQVAATTAGLALAAAVVVNMT